MEDARYTNELIKKHQAGVPVRVLMDPRANATYPLNTSRLNELQTAGIPMRKRLTSYILHWKMMLFHGQNVVEFSGANYSANAWRPGTAVPYENYTDEAIYFTSDSAITDSFRTKFDDHWTNTTEWANYANITQPLVRRYAVVTKDPSLNFPPEENYRTRIVKAYKAETKKVDAVMYRITDRQHTDNLLAAVARGVQVRLITEPAQYRLVDRMWHSWNVDRHVRGRRADQAPGACRVEPPEVGDSLRPERSAPRRPDMVVFGSSNWTSPSAAGQVEHNIFTTKPDLVSWFVTQFERKWNNTGGIVENADFVPLPPDAPKNPSPATGATGVEHHADAEVVWRAVGTPVRRVHRHQLGVHRPDLVRRSRRDTVEDRDQHLQLRCAPRGAPAGHDLLLEGGRQDDGAENEVERGVDLHDRRNIDDDAARRRPLKSSSTPRRRR